MSEATTAEIREALTTLRKFMTPDLYEQLDARLSARENEWPQPRVAPTTPPDDEALEVPA